MTRSRFCVLFPKIAANPRVSWPRDERSRPAGKDVGRARLYPSPQWTAFQRATPRVPLSWQPWRIFEWVETWQDTFLPRPTSHSRRPRRSRGWRATTRPFCMRSDTGVEMRPASSGSSRPALTRNLTPPPNLSPRLRLHFCAPDSATCPGRSTAGKASWAASAHSRRRGMKYLVLDNKHYL